MTKTLPHIDPIEFASCDEIQALQLERMKWTLHHAYNNVPMYKRKFDAAGVHPDDFKQLSDIAKFPYTTKQDLRDNYPSTPSQCRWNRWFACMRHRERPVAQR